jgi:hypothetical protein
MSKHVDPTGPNTLKASVVCAGIRFMVVEDYDEIKDKIESARWATWEHDETSGRALISPEMIELQVEMAEHDNAEDVRAIPTAMNPASIMLVNPIPVDKRREVGDAS